MKLMTVAKFQAMMKKQNTNVKMTKINVKQKY